MAKRRITKVMNILASGLMLAGSVNAADPAERKLLQHPNAEYPLIAVQMHLHGSVKLKIWINPDGSVRRLEYIGGHPLLAESALKAVKTWQYEPGSKESTTVVEVKF